MNEGKGTFKCSDDDNTFYALNIFRNFAIFFGGVLIIQVQSGASQRSPRQSFTGQDFGLSPDNDAEISPEAASLGCGRLRRLSSGNPHDPN